MKKIARFLLLSALLLAALPCFAGCNEHRGMEFVLLEDGTYGVRATSVYHREELVIPEVYEERAVTAILANGFAGATSLKQVTLPSSLRTIEAGAFAGCVSLGDIVLPSSLSNIGASAFSGCTSLPLVKEGNAYYLGSASSPYFYLYKSDSTAIASVTVPEGTAFIADSAFAFCRALTAVSLPASLRAVGTDAFLECTSLATVTAADPSAFASVMFANRSANPASLAGGLTEDGSPLTTITVAEGVTRIGDYAFADFTSLTSITLPEGLLEIGTGAFRACSGLTSLTVPTSALRIGISAFLGCSALRSVAFQNPTSWHHGALLIDTGELSDPALAATYLVGTYHSYPWSRY